MPVCFLCVCGEFVFPSLIFFYTATNLGLDWLGWTGLASSSGLVWFCSPPLWFALPYAPLPSRCSAGIGKLSTADGKAFADPEVLRRLTSSVSCALDEAAAALTRMRAENTLNAGQADKYVSPRRSFFFKFWVLAWMRGVCVFTCHSGSNCSSLVIFSRSLAEACSDGDVNAVRKLLDEGRSVNEHTEEGESLLCLACSAGYYELAQVWKHCPGLMVCFWEPFYAWFLFYFIYFLTLQFSVIGFIGYACQCRRPGHQRGHNAPHGCCQRRLCGHCQTASCPWGRCQCTIFHR